MMTPGFMETVAARGEQMPGTCCKLKPMAYLSFSCKATRARGFANSVPGSHSRGASTPTSPNSKHYNVTLQPTTRISRHYYRGTWAWSNDWLGISQGGACKTA